MNSGSSQKVSPIQSFDAMNFKLIMSSECGYEYPKNIIKK